MRKHNEGYSLPLVLVVMVILSLVSVAIMSVSLRNLQSQKASIDTMKAQYAAQGELEKTIAQLEYNLGHPPVNVGENVTSDAAKMHAETIIKGIASNDAVITWVEDTNGCIVKLPVTSGSVKIECEIKLDNVISESAEDGGSIYMVGKPDVSYLSYTIAAAEEPAPEFPEGGDGDG